MDSGSWIFFFVAPWGNSRDCFCAFLEFAPDFQETNVYKSNFAIFLMVSILSLWYFARCVR